MKMRRCGDENIWKGKMKQLEEELCLTEGDATHFQSLFNDHLLCMQQFSMRLASLVLSGFAYWSLLTFCLGDRKEVVHDGLGKGKEVDIKSTPRCIMVKRVQEKW